ncbi:MAG: alginate export family protein [Planctomycetes bacterium]|nr:alginate export family protein [Planctomycetota bacterium]
MAHHSSTWRACGAGAILSLAALPVLGQDRDLRRREVEASEALRLTETLPEADPRFTADYGGWWRGTGTKFDVANQEERRTLRENDLRVWARPALRKGYVYLRGQFTYTDFNAGDAPDGDEDTSFGPEFDRAFLGLDLSTWFSADLPRDVELRLGRQWFSVGSGTALADTYDGGELSVEQGNADFRAFGAYTIPSRNPDFDGSLPGGDNSSNRVFSGAELRYNELFLGDSPYVYIVLERDRNREHPDDPNQEYEYNSEYVGFGSDGSLLVDNLRYMAEYVYQSGRGFAANAPGQEPNELEAHGGVGGLELLSEAPLHPVLFGRILLGTGDPDRNVINSTLEGHFNKVTTRPETDRSFQYFGYQQTGFASSFLLTNLQVIAAGGSMRPLEFIPWTRELEAGVTYYLYEKVREEGGISDVTATQVEKDVGRELDLYVNWKVASDVTAGLLIGRFETGDVYPSHEIRDFMSANVTIAF